MMTRPTIQTMPAIAVPPVLRGDHCTGIVWIVRHPQASAVSPAEDHSRPEHEHSQEGNRRPHSLTKHTYESRRAIRNRTLEGCPQGALRVQEPDTLAWYASP